MALFSHLPFWGSLRPPVLLAKSQQVAAAEASSLTKTGHTITAGTNYLIAAVGWGRNDTRTISGVTYGGAAMSSLVGVNDNSGGQMCGVAFYGFANPGASGDIVLTMSNNCDGLVIWALDIAGAAGLVVNSGTSTSSGTAAKSISLVTTRPSLMLGMRCVNRDTTSYTEGSGVTEEYDLQHGPGGVGTYFLGSRISTTPESFSFGCTAGSVAGGGDAMVAMGFA